MPSGRGLRVPGPFARYLAEGHLAASTQLTIIAGALVEQLVHVVPDIFSYILTGPGAMVSHVVRDPVEYVRAQGLAAELAIGHLRREDAVAQAVRAEAVTKSPSLPFQPYRAAEVVLH